MRNKEEANIQKQIIDYLVYKRIFCFAVPNGGSRNIIEAKNLKRQGVRSGVADLIILLKKRCIFIEIKIPEKKVLNINTGNYNKRPAGKQSDEQFYFQQKVELLGFEYHIWYSLQNCVDFIESI